MRLLKNKVLRRVLSAVTLIAMLIALDTVIGEALRPVSYATYFNHDLQEIAASGQEVDLLFVGASRVYRSFVPRVFEEELGLSCAVNAGSSSQPYCGTYYQLKDLIERIHPKRVIIGVVYNRLSTMGDTQEKLIVLDRLSLANRMEMAANCFDLSEMAYLSAVYRFSTNFTWNRMTKYRAEKALLAETDYAPIDGTKEYYADKGFVYSNVSYPEGNIPIKSGGFSESRVDGQAVRYLEKCVEICRENGIDVVLVTGPSSLSRLYATRNYQGAVDFFQNFAEEHGVPYYNLNYLKGREAFLPDEYMHDDNHVNGEGARIVSRRFAEILKKADAGEDVSEYFYANLAELQREVHRIVSMRAEVRADEDTYGLYHISCSSLQNEGVETVYRALLRAEGQEEYQILQDWTPSAALEFTVSEPGKYTVRVEAGSTDETMGHAFQEYQIRLKKKK